MALPLPKFLSDIGPGGGIVSGMLGANALTKSNLENQYYGPTAQADIASKTTYARYLPAQILGQVLSNPQVWQTMPKEQLQALSQQYANALSNPPSLESLSGSGGKKGPGLLGMFMNMITGQGNSQGQNAFSSRPSGGGSQNAMLSPGGNSPNLVENNVMPDNEVDALSKNVANSFQGTGAGANGSLPGSTIGRVAQNTNMPGSAGGLNAPAVARAQEASLNSTATTEATEQRQSWGKKFNKLGQNADDQQLNTQNLKKFNAAYDKLHPWETGNYLSKGPVFTENAQDADGAAGALAKSVSAAATPGGYVTDDNLKGWEKIKVGRHMSETSRQKASNFLEGMSERQLELLPFYTKMDQLGYTPQQADVIANHYFTERPFYDEKTGKKNEDNLNTWEDYLEPKKVEEAFSPRARKAAKQAASNLVSENKSTKVNKTQKRADGTGPDNEGGQMPRKGMRFMFDPNGIRREVLDNPANIRHAIDVEGFTEVG